MYNAYVTRISGLAPPDPSYISHETGQIQWSQAGLSIKT